MLALPQGKTFMVTISVEEGVSYCRSNVHSSVLWLVAMLVAAYSPGLCRCALYAHAREVSLGSPSFVSFCRMALNPQGTGINN